jgi:hypothetical protein
MSENLKVNQSGMTDIEKQKGDDLSIAALQ